MRKGFRIVTVGLCPAWDTRCEVTGIEWGQHEVVSRRSDIAAGKALNISKALAWIGEKSMAAGLWGEDNYFAMAAQMRRLKRFIKVEMTVVEGSTRQNITVVDTVNKREIHLRNKSKLVSGSAVERLEADLGKVVTKNSVCVFSGSIPDDDIASAMGVIESCYNRGARIVLDTSGKALREIVSSGMVWLVKPNVMELGQLLQEDVKNNIGSLVKAGGWLLDKAEVVLISSGGRGAIVVSSGGCWSCKYTGKGEKVLSTVGCGDYLLAGFLAGVKQTGRLESALESAVKVGTAKAFGLTSKGDGKKIAGRIKTGISRV